MEPPKPISLIQKKRKKLETNSASASDAEKPEKPDKSDKSDKSEKIDKPTKLSKATRTVKGPIDLDKQCGVRLDSGALCTRSITCKIHSVGAKRAVQGRSQQYDILFQEHQAKNVGRGFKPGDSRAGTPVGKLNGVARIGTGSPAGFGAGDPVLDKPLTKDEEADLVFNAIRLHRPTPMAVQPVYAAVEVVLAFKRRQALVNAFQGKPV
ncbi:hypothetical protein SpCBS45565_g00445 [Spizellomyces sp. 'palustris']|nr:hypothetical protein SpCBS45565_g00445 [Spizellomyces sp. 'palustris']